MDQKKFENWLSTIAEWQRIKPPNPSGRYGPDQHDQPSPEIQITRVHAGHDCGVCNQKQGCQVVHRMVKEQYSAKQPPRWVGYCETCKKRFDPKTGQVVPGKKFVSQGIRQPKPGRRLGRPPKHVEWIRECNVIAAALQEQKPADDPMTRRAELLDRLQALRK